MGLQVRIKYTQAENTSDTLANWPVAEKQIFHSDDLMTARPRHQMTR